MSIYKCEDNPFEILNFDINYKCNMNCNICYNYKKITNKTPDMTVEYYRELMSNLPKEQTGIAVRLLGGEPTLHPQLHEFIKITNEFGHTPMIGTNGVKFNDEKYLEEVMTWKDKEIADKNRAYMGGEYPFCVFIDIGGGTSHNRFYKVLNNMNCLEHKMNAIQNCIKIGIKSMALTAIIARDFNEEVIPELLKLANNHDEIQTIHFRNVSKMGTWGLFEEEPYTIEELKDLIRPHIPELNYLPKMPGYTAPPGKQCYDCCYRFVYNNMSIDLIDFASEDAAKCWKRGTDYNVNHVMTYFERVRQDG